MNPRPTDLAGLTAGRWFQRLPADFAQTLLEMGHLRHLQTGEVLFLRDGAPCGLYGLVSGSVRFSGHGHHADSAREAVLVVLSPPEWFGEISLFDGAPRTHDAHAAEPSTLLHVPHAALLDWLREHPAHWRDIGLLMADKLRLAFVNMEAQLLLPASQRLAQRLVLMAQGHGLAATPDGHRRNISVTQEELALMLGISRQTTNQILQSFKDQGLIAVHRGVLEIVDLEALRALTA